VLLGLVLLDRILANKRKKYQQQDWPLIRINTKIKSVKVA